MRELRIKCGALVMTPDGVREIYSYDPNGTEVTCVTEDGGSISVWHTHQLRPLPADIPRERVADLHAAVAKRVERLNPDTHIVDDAERYAHAELSEVAEALRLLLEADS